MKSYFLKAFTLIAVLAISSALEAQGANYTITDLGTNAPTDLNDNGSVIGTDSLGRGWYYHGGTTIIFTNVNLGWDEDRVTGERLYYYPDSISGLKINNREHVAGLAISSRGYGNLQAFLYTPPSGNNPGSNSGSIVGGDGYDGFVALTDNDRVTLSFNWVEWLFLDNPRVSDNVPKVVFGGPTPFFTISAGNSSDVFVGAAAGGPPPVMFQKWEPSYAARACVVSNGIVTYLDERLPDTGKLYYYGKPDYLSTAVAINSQGHVIGNRYENSLGQAFLYRGNGMEQLAGVAGPSVAIAINDADEVVGYTYRLHEPSSQPFLWKNGASTLLNSLVPTNSGWEFPSALDINNFGQILGLGRYQGATHGFILSPAVPPRPPRIIDQPTNVDLVLHQSYRITPLVAGPSPINYKWLRNDLILTNETGPFLDIPNADASNAGDYKFIASNGGGPVRMEGEVGGKYRLDSASQLESPTAWAPLTTMTFTNATQIYTDTTIGSESHRFYRGVRLP